MTIIEHLDISAGSVVAITGCGGKTSLSELIAGQLRDKKVLLSTTTKIFPMKTCEAILCETLQQCMAHRPQTGIQCFGILNKRSGKLEALPGPALKELVSRYDVALLEADGARGLPCKGWLETEPVVPDYCTHTIGVATLRARGRAASRETVHNLPEFLSLTGTQDGEPITAQALETMICAPGGMFKSSAGRLYLVINQVEDGDTEHEATSLLKSIKEKYPDRFSGLISGSVQLNNWRRI